MMRISAAVFAISLLALVLLSSCRADTDLCRVVNPRTEYLVNPLGIDVAAPRFTWQLEDSRQGAMQRAYRVVLGKDSASLVDGSDILWDTGKVNTDHQLLVYDGPGLAPLTRYYWRVTVWDMDGKRSAEPALAWFETGMMGNDNWKGYWISDVRDKERKPAAYFRKDFVPLAKVKEARIYIGAGGYFELYINGKRVGDHMLDPSKTRYDRRNLYVVHDVTAMLNEGDNTLGVILGNGWYNHQSRAVWFFHEVPWRARPSFCADLRIIYHDDGTETIGTDSDWKTATGPIVFNSIYTAEHYDARLEMESWSSPGFDDTNWRNSIRVAAPSQQIVAQALHPVRKTKRIPVVSMTSTGNNTWLFDLGRNIAGVSELTVSGERGTMIRLMHGERLGADGHVDMSNIDLHYRPIDDSDPFQTDIFILGGKENESFSPRFNYKGFRYVEVSADRPLSLSVESLCGYVMHSDVPVAGHIHSSNETLNRIWWAGNNSYLANLFAYPTDCPQREKLGWTGDGHIAMETGLYNFDGITIYEKWIADHRDEQQPNGVLPAIIPSSGWGYHWANGVDWTSSLAIVPWNIYLFYGDPRLLYETYDNIKNYVNYIEHRYPGGLTDWGLGDWVPVRSRANVELTSTVYYHVVTSILAQAAKMFNKYDDHERYALLADMIKNAFNNKFLDSESGNYGSGYQTELAMPLFWGLVPDSLIGKVAANLAEKVMETYYHIDVGLLGSKALLNALSENGYANIAYKVASRESFPSWGWWIVNGATTFLENWDIHAERDISMNHIMFGEVSAWFYKALGGIKPDVNQPGFKNIMLEPHFVEGLGHFEARYKSSYGEIVSKWEKNTNGVLYRVTIPPNSTATLKLPGEISVEEGTPLRHGIESGSKERELLNVLELAAGNYRFRIGLN